MARRSVLRASDSDREQVAERLRAATAEGRLLASELEERLERLFSSRTYAELDALVADLPVPSGRRRGSSTPLWVRAGFVAALVLGALLVAAAVALIVVGIAGAWMAWLFVMWLALGRGRWHGHVGCASRRRGAFRAAEAGSRGGRCGRAGPFL